MNFLSWDIRYIKTMNSCDRTKIRDMIIEIIDIPDGLKKRRYLWNLFRGKNFYIPLADYVVFLARKLIYEGDDPGTIYKIRYIIRSIVQSEKNRDVISLFIYNILNHVNIIMLDMFPYTNPKKIEGMLTGNKPVLIDPELDSFGNVIKYYKDRVKDLENQVSILSIMTDD